MNETNDNWFIQIDDINDTAALEAAMAEMDKRIREQAALNKDEGPIPKEMFISSDNVNGNTVFTFSLPWS